MSALAQTPYKFDFFVALRRLECAHRDRPRLGRAALPADEPIRLGQEPSLAAAPSALARFSPGEDGRPSRLTVHFLGALGPNGPLPLHLTDYARQRVHHHGDSTLSRFLDLFHHRILSLFYRAWADSQPVVQRDRPERDRFMLYVGALIGLGLPALRGRDALPDGVKLYYAGRFAAQARNAEGLRAIVTDYFGMPAQIEEFVGEWVQMPKEHGFRLGAPALRGGPVPGLLGRTTIVGRRVWVRQHRFRIVLGPLRDDQFRRMLPGGESLPRLAALVRNYVGDELAWDLRLVLSREAVQPLALGVRAQLVRTSWLVGSPGRRRHEDVVFDPLQELRKSDGHERAASATFDP